jgi:hypothetical protein
MTYLSDPIVIQIHFGCGPFERVRRLIRTSEVIQHSMKPDRRYAEIFVRDRYPFTEICEEHSYG